MPDTAIQIEHVSKMYRLGVINNGTFYQDFQSWIALKRGKEDPHSKIEENKYSGDKDHFWALKDVSFELKQGDRFGIIGKNGAGKSTLLKILSRITTPTEGTVKIKGEVASLLEVGTGFHAELTGRENIYLNGAIRGMKKRRIDELLDEIIEFSGIEKYIDTPVKRYSSGMYVRLAFAVAAHLDSDIMISDEVLAVGDAEFQKKALRKMQDLSAVEGKTVLFVSHNMAAIRRLCKTGVLLKEGSIIKTGEIEEVTDAYINNFVSDNQVRSVDFEPDKTLPMSINHIEIYAKERDKDVVFDTSDTLMVKIRYSVYEDNLAGINIGFTLSTKDGIIVFRSWDIDSNQKLFESRKKGDYETEFELPDILNMGQYSMTVAYGRTNVGAIQNFVNCIAFDIENVKVDGYTKSFTRGGLIKSSINWSLKKIC
jgi:lipopolysaccharide transport system ATP-binding protein